MILKATVTFWFNLRTNSSVNDEPLANTAL